MKLTTKSEYSILALIFLAREKKGVFVKGEDICECCHLSKKYLEQLLFILKRQHLVRAKRGFLGGYSLAKPATQITLAEVIRLMDGALAPTESASVFFYAETPLSQNKKALRVFKDIRNFIAKKLEEITISDLI